MSFQAAALAKDSSFGAQRTTSPISNYISCKTDLERLEILPYLSWSAFRVSKEWPLTTVRE